MANEVVITYYKVASNNKGVASGVYGEPLGGEVLDIGTRSAVCIGDYVRLVAKGTGFWYRVGGDGVNAVANTDGNDYLAAGSSVVFQVGSGYNYIDTAADA